MKAILGGICFVLGLLCAGGLFLSTVRLAWAPLEGFDSAIAYVGFGVPLLTLGVATGALWAENRRLVKWCLGWSCAALAVVNALGLLALLAGWVGLIPGRLGQGLKLDEAVGVLLAFGIPMLVCGGAGIGILTSESNTHQHWEVKARPGTVRGQGPGPRAEADAAPARDPAAAASPEAAVSKPWWQVVAEEVSKRIR